MNKESLLPFSIEVMVNILKNLNSIHTRDAAKARSVSKQFNEGYLALVEMNNGEKNLETQFINQLTKYMLGESFCNTFVKRHNTDYVSMFDFFVGQCQKIVNLSIIENFKEINGSDFQDESWKFIEEKFTPQFKKVETLLEKHGMEEDCYEYAISLFAVAGIKQFPEEKGTFNLFLVTPSVAAVQVLHFYDPTIIFSKWRSKDSSQDLAFVDLSRLSDLLNKNRDKNLRALYEMFNQEDRNKFIKIICTSILNLKTNSIDVDFMINVRKVLIKIMNQAIEECEISKKISPQIKLFSIMLDKFYMVCDQDDYLKSFTDLLVRIKNIQLEIKDREIEELKQQLGKRNIAAVIGDLTESRQVRQKM